MGRTDFWEGSVCHSEDGTLCSWQAPTAGERDGKTGGGLAKATNAPQFWAPLCGAAQSGLGDQRGPCPHLVQEMGEEGLECCEVGLGHCRLAESIPGEPGVPEEAGEGGAGAEAGGPGHMNTSPNQGTLARAVEAPLRVHL